jgi:hypothetical protein
VKAAVRRALEHAGLLRENLLLRERVGRIAPAEELRRGRTGRLMLPWGAARQNGMTPRSRISTPSVRRTAAPRRISSENTVSIDWHVSRKW